jgi:aspartate oxidase
MPSEVGITLGIRQALYAQPIAFPKLHPTTLSQGRTLLHDLLVSLRIGGEGDFLLLHGGVSHDLLSLLGLVCLQGHG